MSERSIPPDPSVLNTTVLSNFAYIDQLWVITGLSGICTVPVVREELKHGVENHRYLQSALDALDSEIPVPPLSEQVANRESALGEHIDAGEAQALALADVHKGRLLTDDGDARSLAKEHGIPVVGSIGVLLAAIDADKIDESTANEWLSTWIDDIGFYAPYRRISEYR